MVSTNFSKKWVKWDHTFPTKGYFFKNLSELLPSPGDLGYSKMFPVTTWLIGGKAGGGLGNVEGLGWGGKIDIPVIWRYIYIYTIYTYVWILKHICIYIYIYMTNTQEMCGKEVVNICNPRFFFLRFLHWRCFRWRLQVTTCVANK